MSTEQEDRDALIGLQLASARFIASDGYPSIGVRTNEEAADLVIEWLASRHPQPETTEWEYDVAWQNGAGLLDTLGEVTVAREYAEEAQINHLNAGADGAILVRRTPAGPWLPVTPEEEK